LFRTLLRQKYSRRSIVIFRFRFSMEDYFILHRHWGRRLKSQLSGGCSRCMWSLILTGLHRENKKTLEYILTPYYKKKTATLKTQVRIYSSDLETLPNIEKVLGSAPIFNKETGWFNCKLSTEPEEITLSLTYFLLAFHFSALEVMVWIANYFNISLKTYVLHYCHVY
jgi:hypothetical protein